jgi:hypothetical protein
MPATIMIENDTATLDDGEWSASDPRLLDLVIIATDPDWTYGYQPNPDTYVATKVAEIIGATVIKSDPIPQTIADRVY